jgi:HemY protein
MAALERAEHNEEGRAREWLARAVHAAPEPAWTADGHVSEHWQAASPVTGRLDAFEWRVPLTGMESVAVIESDLPPPAMPALVDTADHEDPEPPRAAPEPPDPPPGKPDVPEIKVEVQSEPAPEPIIPLIHAPDDPGPDAVPETEPHAEQPNSGWRKIFG